MVDTVPPKVTDTEKNRWPKVGPSHFTDHRECAEDYRGELFRISIYRVAECRDGLQWLYQRQRPRFQAGGVAWDTLGYCATKTGLRRLHRLHVGDHAPEIEALPDGFQRRRWNG